MIELFAEEMLSDNRKSSKGNQYKWQKGDVWYKADYCGYEGLTEYVVSELLQYSSLTEDMFVPYKTEELYYNNRKYYGCSSPNFLNEGEQLITLERLFHNQYSSSFYKAVYSIEDYEERLRFLVNQVQRLTGLEKFGEYISIIVAIDALVLNEDRHLHNIAVICDRKGRYKYAPIFDNGAGLLSDLRLDYPMEMDVYEAIDSVKSKTFCDNFDIQLEIADKMYGKQLAFSWGYHEVEEILQNEKYYSKEEKDRVSKVLMDRRRAYQYLFQ